MFFSSAAPGTGDPYRLLVEATRFADAHGFVAVWTPERHFHPFGGLFPDPAVTSAALAMVSERIQLRAGSLISPLHDSVRIAESWSVVDNLSGGRAAISFGSGWNGEDFVFFPDRHARRQEVMYRQIEEVRALWRGEAARRDLAGGRQVDVVVHPKPVQPELPVWVTSSGNPATFTSAGEIGAHLLTHLIGQTVDELAEKIARYREARAATGLDPAAGTVSLMLHTFMGPDSTTVRETVRQPFREYLRSAISLEQMAAQGSGVVSGGHVIEPHDISPADMEDLLDLTFERYYTGASLLGTPEECYRRLDRFRAAGVDEIACLIDFIPDPDAVLESLRWVTRLRDAVTAEERRSEAAGQAAVASFSEEAWSG